MKKTINTKKKTMSIEPSLPEKSGVSIVTKPSSSHSKVQSNENLFICINDVSLKRKYLLESLKYSLVLQEEHEKIKEIRVRKAEILLNIKNEMESVNLKYQSLKKILPNVKNVISFTEKELNELDMQVEFLRRDVKNKTKEIEIEERTAENVAAGMKLYKNRKVGYTENSEVKVLNVAKPKEKEVNKPLTKLERIQNNLKLIESKLKNI